MSFLRIVYHNQLVLVLELTLYASIYCYMCWQNLFLIIISIQSGKHRTLCNKQILPYTVFVLFVQPPPGVDAPLMDTAEIVYISSLALLKVSLMSIILFQACSSNFIIVGPRHKWIMLNVHMFIHKFGLL